MRERNKGIVVRKIGKAIEKGERGINREEKYIRPRERERERKRKREKER